MQVIKVVVWVWAFVIGVSSVHSQVPGIVSTVPSQNAIAIDRSTAIAVTFSTSMDETTLNPSTFLVQGSFSGLHEGVMSFSDQTNTIMFDPLKAFSPGEIVSVSLTTGIASSGGVYLSFGHVLCFTVRSFGGGGTFSSSWSYLAGETAKQVTGSDINGDTKVDLVCSNWSASSASVMLSSNDGFPSTPTYYYDLGGAHCSAHGDFDHDGDIDVAVANEIANDVRILWNAGDGTLSMGPLLAVGAGPEFMIAADLNGDGWLDLATADHESNNVSVLINAKDAIFLPRRVFGVGNHPRSVTWADLDGDFDLDLVTADWYGGTLSLILNNGGGFFAGMVNLAVGTSPESVCAVDLDSDGDMDLVSGNHHSDNITRWMNTGAGSFTDSRTWAAGDGPGCVAANDLDGDGDMDVCVANFYTDDVSVFFNDGVGNLSLSVSVPAGDTPRSVFIADLDGDLDLDLATANWYSGTVVISWNDSPEPPETPAIIAPVGDDLILYDMLPTFSWTSVTDPNPLDEIHYRLELAVDSNFTFVMTLDSLVEPTYQLADSLMFNTHYWWRVRAIDLGGLSSVSNTADFWTWTLGDVNHNHKVTLGDILVMIDHLFIRHTPIIPRKAGDVNGDCKIALGDVMRLISHLFFSGAELRVGCE